jgi:hypothetical protein
MLDVFLPLYLLAHIIYTSLQPVANGYSIAEYPNIRRCYDLLGTLRLGGKEFDAVRPFFTEVEQASPEELEAIDKERRKCLENPCSQTLAFLEAEVKELNRERKQGLINK